MNHLVMKARFEEVKRRELAAVRSTSPLPRRVSQSSPTAPANIPIPSPEDEPAGHCCAEDEWEHREHKQML